MFKSIDVCDLQSVTVGYSVQCSNDLQLASKELDSNNNGFRNAIDLNRLFVLVMDKSKEHISLDVQGFSDDIWDVNSISADDYDAMVNEKFDPVWTHSFVSYPRRDRVKKIKDNGYSDDITTIGGKISPSSYSAIFPRYSSFPWCEKIWNNLPAEERKMYSNFRDFIISGFKSTVYLADKDYSEYDYVVCEDDVYFCYLIDIISDVYVKYFLPGGMDSHDVFLTRTRFGSTILSKGNSFDVKYLDRILAFCFKSWTESIPLDIGRLESSIRKVFFDKNCSGCYLIDLNNPSSCYQYVKYNRLLFGYHDVSDTCRAPYVSVGDNAFVCFLDYDYINDCPVSNEMDLESNFNLCLSDLDGFMLNNNFTSYTCLRHVDSDDIPHYIIIFESKIKNHYSLKIGTKEYLVDGVGSQLGKEMISIFRSIVISRGEKVKKYYATRCPYLDLLVEQNVYQDPFCRIMLELILMMEYDLSVPKSIANLIYSQNMKGESVDVDKLCSRNYEYFWSFISTNIADFYLDPILLKVATIGMYCERFCGNQFISDRVAKTYLGSGVLFPSYIISVKVVYGRTNSLIDKALFSIGSYTKLISVGKFDYKHELSSINKNLYNKLVVNWFVGVKEISAVSSDKLASPVSIGKSSYKMRKFKDSRVSSQKSRNPVVPADIKIDNGPGKIGVRNVKPKFTRVENKGQTPKYGKRRFIAETHVDKVPEGISYDNAPTNLPEPIKGVSYDKLPEIKESFSTSILKDVASVADAVINNDGLLKSDKEDAPDPSRWGDKEEWKNNVEAEIDDANASIDDSKDKQIGWDNCGMVKNSSGLVVAFKTE